MFHIYFRTNSLDTFTEIKINDYQQAKENYKSIIEGGYKNVTLTDSEGLVLMRQDQE